MDGGVVEEVTQGIDLFLETDVEASLSNQAMSWHGNNKWTVL
jgi:hypothetical protein